MQKESTFFFFSLVMIIPHFLLSESRVIIHIREINSFALFRFVSKESIQRKQESSCLQIIFLNIIQ